MQKLADLSRKVLDKSEELCENLLRWIKWKKRVGSGFYKYVPTNSRTYLDSCTPEELKLKIQALESMNETLLEIFWSVYTNEIIKPEGVESKNFDEFLKGLKHGKDEKRVDCEAGE
jgi:hypothetical protein